MNDNYMCKEGYGKSYEITKEKYYSLLKQSGQWINEDNVLRSFWYEEKDLSCWIVEDFNRG